MVELIPSAIPIRTFEDHEARVSAVAVFSDKQRMVTCSDDKMLLLWDLTTGAVLKKMEGHQNRVQALAVSRDGRLIASGDTNGELITWNGETGEPLGRDRNTGESLAQTISAHTGWILSLDFSPDDKVLVSGSSDSTAKLWNTSTWELQRGVTINFGANTVIRCVRYSPSGLLAIATQRSIYIYRACYTYSYHFGNRFELQAQGTIGYSNSESLAWTPNGSLLTGGDQQDPTIREWDTSNYNYKQVGDPLKGHFNTIRAISLNSIGTLVASASHDNRVRLWRLSDRRTIAVFKHSAEVHCVIFSAHNTHILSGGVDKKISEWSASEDTSSLTDDGPKGGLMKDQVTHQARVYSNVKVLAMDLAVRNACIAGDWLTAEMVLYLEINAAADTHNSYANRALVMARKCDWDHALHDAIKSVSIQPSFSGHISKGIALCGKKQVRAARTSFDFASMFTNGDLKIGHFLFFIKTIALFNANEHEEAMERVEELSVSPNVDPLACRIVEAYLRVQLGNIALDRVHYNEAVEHFTAAVNASAFFYTLEIHSMYEEFVVLFGWDLKSLWQTANQQQCYALFRAGRIGAAVESYESIMEKSDEATKASICAWFAALK